MGVLLFFLDFIFLDVIIVMIKTGVKYHAYDCHM